MSGEQPGKERGAGAGKERIREGREGAPDGYVIILRINTVTEEINTNIDINISTYIGKNKLSRRAALLPFLRFPGGDPVSQNVFSRERCLLPGV